ncbi:hypothetical protein [Nocardia sp. NPDC003726]
MSHTDGPSPFDSAPTAEESRSPEQVAWAKLRHLAAHGTGLPAPTFDELGIVWVHDVCERLGRYRRADFEPDITVDVAKSQWRETCALAGSIAETLMLGAAAAVEIMWHDNAMRGGKEPLGMGLGQRFFADALIETTVAAAHRLINLVARVMRTDADTCARMGGHGQLKELGPGYVPFETIAERAWPPLNKTKVDALRTVADPASTSIHAMLNHLDALVLSPEWELAFMHRAANFHRLRLEHPYVAGVDPGTGRVRNILDHEGKIIGRSFHSRPAPYTAAEGLDTQVVTDARAFYDATAHAAGKVITTIVDGLHDLTGNVSIVATPTSYEVRYQ